jgi:hypothetical protein
MKVEVLMQVYYKGQLVLIDSKYEVVGRETKYFIIYNNEVLIVKESQLVFVNTRKVA